MLFEKPSLTLSHMGWEVLGLDRGSYNFFQSNIASEKPTIITPTSWLD
jgi:hypothetical protein